MTRRARWLASLVKRGYFTAAGVLRYPVVDPDSGVVYSPEADRAAHRAGHATPKGTAPCRHCGGAYQVRHGGQRYCSRECGQRGRTAKA